MPCPIKQMAVFAIVVFRCGLGNVLFHRLKSASDVSSGFPMARCSKASEYWATSSTSSWYPVRPSDGWADHQGFYAVLHSPVQGLLHIVNGDIVPAFHMINDNLAGKAPPDRIPGNASSMAFSMAPMVSRRLSL